MAKVTEKLEDGLMLVAEWVDDNKYLTSVKNAFTIFMPFIIVGSFATLFNSVLCSETTGLAKWIPWLANLKSAFTAINFATMSFMSISVIFLISMQLAKIRKIPEYIAGIVGVVSYVSVIPQVVTVTVDEVTGVAAGVPSAALGAQGLFMGMIIAILATELFSLLMKIDKLKIKMPSSVPSGITTSFNTIIPIMITVSVTAIIGGVFYMSTGQYLNEFIYSAVQAPLEVIFQSPIGVVAIVIISQVFWFLGIHGGLVISPIRNPLIAAAVAANIAAVAEGGVATQAVTYGFWLNFVVAGGAGICLSLIFAIFIFSKREDHRMIGKLSFLPAIFGISEPIVFGLPLVLNPTFLIPFVFNSGIATLIALFATNIGFMQCNTVDTPFGVPILLGPLIGHGWQGVVVQIVILAMCTITWSPFVLMANKQVKIDEDSEVNDNEQLEMI